MRLLVKLAPADPRYGLAVDEVLADRVRAGAPEAVRFWVNRRAVVVGRSQSVADEVDIAHATQANIPILRRISGGGTVYHHPGNLNLSVAVGRRDGMTSVVDAFSFFGEAVAGALAPWAELVCEGNALRIAGRKIGGAAQARRGDVLLYHTTLLVASDAIPMERLLLAHRPGYAPKRVASKPSETITLTDVVEGPVRDRDVGGAIADELAKRLEEKLEPDDLTRDECRWAEELVASKYGRDAWNRLH